MASTAYPMTPSISMLHDRMDTGTERRRKRPPNTGSQLLDNQENYRLFELLGPDNVSLYAAVVELLTTDSRQWRRYARGVISLVKDYHNRAYFLRLYDLIGAPELIWEFKLYKNFQSFMTPKCNQLLTFEGEFDGPVFGLNFSSPDEARSFKGHLDKRYEQERKTMAARDPRPALPPASSVFSTTSNTPAAPVATASPYTNGVTPVGTIAHTEKTPVSSATSFFKKKKKDKKPRIRKEDISNPTNFQHKAHVGWDQDSGFSNNVDSDPMDESIKNIIRAAGQDPNNLSKKTIKFVYDFIERYEENTSSDHIATPQFSRHQAPPPPVPISQPISQWAAPPPPPPSRGASYGSTAPPSRPPPPPPAGPGVRAIHARPLPQVPPSAPETRPAAVPPPPPPPSLPNIAPVVGGPSVPPAPPPPPPLSSMAPAAPPPPPSLSSSMPPPPPPSLSAMPPPQSGRGDLLAQIQAGKQLRSVTTNAEKKAPASGADARGDVMAQIRLGANLKHVDHAAVEQEKRKSAPTLADMGGIAGALAKALEERRMNMCIDDSSDDDESDEKNEWSD